MVEFLLPFSLGYFACRIFQYFISSSQDTSGLRESVLLRWDNTVFGWRVVTSVSESEKGIRYMIARPVSPEFISSVIKFRKSDD